MLSVRSRFVLLAAAILAVSQLGTLITIYLHAGDDPVDQSLEILDQGDTRFGRHMITRADTLQKSVGTLTADQGFLRAADADPVAARRILAGHVAGIGAEFGLLLDGDGRVVLATQEIDAEQGMLEEIVTNAREDRIYRGSVATGGRYYETVTLPIGNERALWLSIAYPIGAELVAELREHTGVDIAIVSGEPGSARLLGASVDVTADAPGRIDLRSLARQPEYRLPGADGGRFLVRQYPFVFTSQQLSVLLMSRVKPATIPSEPLVSVVVALGIAALAIAFAGATALSRMLLSPLAGLVTFARRIGTGDYRQNVSAGQCADLGELAGALATMQREVGEREARISRHAHYDRLTGLPNRYLAVQQLRERIRTATGTDRTVSIALLSLSRFGEIASSFGHELGDALLIQSAERLKATADARHDLARLDGGDFMMIMDGVTPEAARDAAADLLVIFGAGLAVENVNFCVDARVGIAAFPAHGEEPDELLLHAAIAKNDARDRNEQIAIYEPGRDEMFVRQLSILGDLRRAVYDDELKLYMQPKVRLADGSLCGAEALTRWDHPTLGFLPPAEFISIAEASGNIGLITQWALTAAIRECRLWIEEGLDLPVSVNLSSRDLLDPDLPCFVLETLRDHDLDARYLTLEITEESLVNDIERATVVLQCLRDLGIRISIDDFGTGHSSLARIKNLPIDELKIDRSFITNLPDDRTDLAIARATIELAHSLRLDVLAEGVESKPAMRWLADQGCEFAQGYFISRPMPAETFPQWATHYGADVTAYVSVLGAINR